MVPNKQEVDEGHREACGGEPRVAEDREIEHGVRAAQLDGHERRQRGHSHRERREDLGARPAVVGTLDDAEHQRHQTDEREQRAHRVGSPGVGVA